VVWGCAGDLDRPEAFGSRGLSRLPFVLAMPESLPAVPIVASRSDKCAYQAEGVSSRVKHLSCPEGARPRVEGVGSGLRLERQYNARKHKINTIEASMLLKTQEAL
jgi:hypothetical protein